MPSFGVGCNDLAGVIGSVDGINALAIVDALLVDVVVAAGSTTEPAVAVVNDAIIPTDDAVMFFITLPNSDELS